MNSFTYQVNWKRNSIQANNIITGTASSLKQATREVNEQLFKLGLSKSELILTVKKNDNIFIKAIKILNNFIFGA